MQLPWACSALLLVVSSASVSATPTPQNSVENITSPENSLNVSRAPSFEILAGHGLTNLRLFHPYTELKVISTTPIKDQRHESTDAKDFVGLTLLGQDTRSKDFLRIDNEFGKDVWPEARVVTDMPGGLDDLPSFKPTDLPITFEAAFRKIRRTGRTKPWAQVRLSKETFVEGVGISYYFVDERTNRNVVVDAFTGDLFDVPLPVTSSTSAVANATWFTS